MPPTTTRKYERNTEENSLMLRTMQILSEEEENILSQILKCTVCFELPKKVRICEKGHHFCLACHRRLEFCGICRGKLLETRNFAVEQLVSRLGPLLGITRDLPPPEAPCKLSRGLFKCLHGCRNKMPAFRMLSHLRSKHSGFLVDNVRSNPYSGEFSLQFDQKLTQNDKYFFSAHVSDMGIFTIEVNFVDYEFFGCVRMMAGDAHLPLFRYQMVVKIPNSESGGAMEYSATNCAMSGYETDTDHICEVEYGGLLVRKEEFSQLIGDGSTFGIFFSVWRKEMGSSQKAMPSVSCLPKTHLYFQNDRKNRRVKSRNARRKKLMATLRNVGTLERSLSHISL